MADTIHGCEVLEATDFVKRGGCLDTRAVLVDRGGGELVTALQAKWPDGRPQAEWFGGHYFRDEAKARRDYGERARRLVTEAGLQALQADFERFAGLAGSA